MTNISAEQAQTILQFLARTQISGAEAPAFMECVMTLRMVASSPMEHHPVSTIASAEIKERIDA